MENKLIKILAIDDTPDKAKVVSAFCSEKFPNYQLLIAHSGKEIIESGLHELPDIIFIDTLDAYEVCRTLKASVKLKHIPVIMLISDSNHKESRIKALDAGADAFMTKPLDESEFTFLVNAMLRIKQSEDRKLSEHEWLEKMFQEHTKSANEGLESIKNRCEELLLSEQNLQTLIDSMTEAMAQNEVIFDNNGEIVDYRILKVNKAFYQILNLPPDIVIGGLASKIYGLTVEEISGFWKINRSKNTTAFTEMYFDSSDQWFHITTSPLKDNKFVTTFFEITGRKRAENELIKSEERFKQVAETSGVWVWEIDSEGLYTYASPNGVSILGYTSEEIVGKKFFYDFITPEVKEQLKTVAFGVFSRREKFRNFINPNLHKNGQVIILETSGLPLFDENGKFTGYRGADSDVTQRENARQMTKASEKKFATAFKNAPVLLSISEYETGRYIDVNQRFLEVSGFSRQEVIGKTSVEIGLISPEERKLIIDGFVKFKKVTELELHLKKKSGEEIICLFNGELINVDGNDCILSLAVDITSSRLAEDALRESEYFFKESQHAAFVGSYKTNFINGLWESSEVLDQIFGIGKSYVRNIQGWLDLVHPADREMMSHYLVEVINQKMPFNKEYRIVRKSDGKTRWLYGLGKATFDKDGKIITLTGTIQDITERKLAEETIKESEIRFKNLFENAADAIFIADAETGIIVDANQASTRLMMMPLERIIGLHQTQLHPTENKAYSIETFQSSLAQAQQTKPVHAIETQVLRADGSKIPVEVLASKVSIQGKQCLMGTFRDITGRKHSEKIQQIIFNISNASLTSTRFDDFMESIKNEIGNLIDTTNFFVALYDEKTDIITLPYYKDKNDQYESFPAGKTLTGYLIKTGKSILAKHDKISRLEESGIIERIGSKSKIWLGVPLSVKEKVTGAIVVQSYDDENAFSQADLKILEFVATQISLAIERKKTEQDLNNALIHARESDRLKSTFLATMSHELRTPLNAVIGFSELIGEDIPMENILDFAQIINNSGAQLLELVEEIFDITLLESGQLKIKQEEFLINPLLTEIYETISIDQQKMSKEDILIKFDPIIADNDFFIFTDPRKLKQIFMNLLKNALKFTHTGFIEFGYRKIANIDIPVIEFFVQDTGIGIPEESRELIFEIFRQGDDSHTRNYGGTGIGLSVAKKLTELLGGKISVQSQVDVGSTFFFTIPYTKTTNEIPMTTEKATAIAPNYYPGKTILIAEDEDSNYEFLEVVIIQTSAEIIRAKNGLEALQICNSGQKIDLVLMDLKMPLMTGYQAVIEIRKNFPNLPIIAQTAYAMPGDSKKALEAGCNDYISKPIKKQALMEKINKYLTN